MSPRDAALEVLRAVAVQEVVDAEAEFVELGYEWRVDPEAGDLVLGLIHPEAPRSAVLVVFVDDADFTANQYELDRLAQS